VALLLYGAPLYKITVQIDRLEAGRSCLDPQKDGYAKNNIVTVSARRRPA